MAGATLKIGGVEKKLLRGTLNISRRTHARSTASFTVVDHGALDHFHFNQPCEILDLDGVTPVFVGWLDDIVEESWLTVGGESRGLLHRISAKDNTYLADKRVVKNPEGYKNMHAGTIVESIIDDILVDEGITAGDVQAGAMVTRLPADTISAWELIEKLADMSNFVAKVNMDRSVDFRPRTSVSAPIVSYGTGMLRGTVKVRRRNFSYRNRQHVVGSDPVSRGVGRSGINLRAVGDGAAQSFDMGVYLSRADYVRVSTDGGATWEWQTIGESDDPSTFGGGAPQWQWRTWDDVLYQNPSETELGVGDIVELPSAFGWGSIDQEVVAAATGEDRYTLARYQPDAPYDDAPRVEVDRGSGYVLESSQVLNSATETPSADWVIVVQSNVLQYVGGSPPGNGDSIRVTRGDTSTTDIIYENAGEIALNQAIEGGTTSGIVEAVINAMESESDAESTQEALAELNRWSHKTLEVEYETYLSGLVDGEVATVDLPDHAIDEEELLIDEVQIYDVLTDGMTDQKDSPLRYRVSTLNAGGDAASGAIGRSSNPRRFSDLIRQLNDRVRLPQFRPPGTIEVMTIVTFALPVFLGTATMSTEMEEPEVPDPIVWVVGDDYASEGDGAPIETLDNRIAGQPDLVNRSTPDDEWYATVETAGPNGHTSLFFEDFEIDEEQDWYSNDTPSLDPIIGLDGTAVTAFLVLKIIPMREGFGDFAFPFFFLGDSHELFLALQDQAVSGAPVPKIWLGPNGPSGDTVTGDWPDDGEWVLVGITLDGDQGTIRINGTEIASGSVDFADGDLDEVHLGNFDLFAPAEIAEFLVYNVVLTTEQLGIVEGGLMTMYGIP
jgi:hypothetical protein